MRSCCGCCGKEAAFRDGSDMENGCLFARTTPKISLEPQSPMTARNHGRELYGKICAFTDFIEYSLAFLRIALIPTLLLCMDTGTTRSYTNARYFLQVSHIHRDRVVFIISTASLRFWKATVHFHSAQPRRVMQGRNTRFLFPCHSFFFRYVYTSCSLCLSVRLHCLLCTGPWNMSNY